MASTAANFLFIWASLRGAPVYRMQRFPAGTPRVGQGTEINCLWLRSFSLIRIDTTQVRQTAQFGTPVPISDAELCFFGEIKCQRTLGEAVMSVPTKIILDANPRLNSFISPCAALIICFEMANSRCFSWMVVASLNCLRTV